MAAGELSDEQVFGKGFTYGPGAAEAGQPVTPAQADYARAMAAHRDPGAPVGTPQNPAYDTPTAVGGEHIYHVGPEGRVFDPVATAQQAAGVKPEMSDADVFGPDFTPGQTFDTRPVSQGLGAAQGAGVVAKNLADVFRPLFDPASGLRNLANATVLKANPLPDINPVDVVGDLYGRKVADAARTYRPGAEGKAAAEIGLTIPLAAAGEGAPYLAGALQGALMSESDQPLARLRDIAAGAVGGKIGDIGGKALSSAIWPAIRPQVQWALDNDIRITPGAIMGGAAQKVERAASKGFFAGPMIGAAQQRGIEDFNTATARHVLDGTGLALPANVPAGHELVNATHNILSDSFNALTPKLTLAPDAPLDAAVSEAVNAGTLLPPAYRARMGALISQLPAKAGPIDGLTVQDLTAQLRDEANDALQSGDFFAKKYGRAVDKLRSAVEDGLERANPEHAEQLQSLRAAYAKQVRVERAARDAVQDGGIYTPKGLLAAVRSTDQSVRDNATARGEALLQDWANTGKAVLPDKLNDRLPPLQSLAAHLPELLVTAGVGHESGYGAAAGLLAGAEGGIGAIYTKPMQKALTAMLTKRPAFAEDAAALAKRLEPLLQTGGALTGAKYIAPRVQSYVQGLLPQLEAYAQSKGP